MARLPIPGGDENQWGDVLNDYLSQAHNSDGSAKDATDTYKGVVQLSGDLSGTADSPTVPGLSDKADQAALDAHINDATDAHAATAIGFTPTGSITSTNTQSAIAEVSSAVDAFEVDALNNPVQVTHDPTVEGLTNLEQKLMTLNGSQTLELSITNGRLRGSRSQATGGNMRSFVLVDGTEWVDSEIELILWGPSIYGSDGNDRPQMGTIHRFGEANGKRWGFVVWWNIVVFGPDVWNLAMWGADLDGNNFNNASGAQQTTTGLWTDRSARGYRANRFNFGSWVQDHYVSTMDAEKLRWLVGGDTVNVTEFVDKTRTVSGITRTASSAAITFTTNALLPQDVGKRITGTGISAGTTIATVTSATAGTLSANASSSSSASVTLSETVADPTVLNGTGTLNGTANVRTGGVQIIGANQTAGAQDTNASHLITPAAAHRRYFPLRVSSRLIGNRLQARIARLEDKLPEWEDTTRVATLNLVAPTNLPSGFVGAGITDIPSTAGRCGIVFAHAVSPHYMEAGLFKARKL